MLVDEQVAMFLHILAHDPNNRVVQFEFGRSGETISRYFNYVLSGVLKLQSYLLKASTLVQARETDERWKWFEVNATSFVFVETYVIVSLTQMCCYCRDVWGHWTEHTSLYMCLPMQKAVIGIGRES